MRINAIKENEVNVTLKADELVEIQNLMCFFKKHHKIDKNAGEPDACFHELATQIITARNLCQYGHLDSWALSRILKHKIAANPEGSWLKDFKEIIQKADKGE